MLHPCVLRRFESFMTLGDFLRQLIPDARCVGTRGRMGKEGRIKKKKKAVKKKAVKRHYQV